ALLGEGIAGLQNGPALADRSSRLWKVRPVGVEVLFPVGPFFSFVFLGASQNTFQKRFGSAICGDRFARRRALRPRGGRPSNPSNPPRPTSAPNPTSLP